MCCFRYSLLGARALDGSVIGRYDGTCSLFTFSRILAFSRSRDMRENARHVRECARMRSWHAGRMEEGDHEVSPSTTPTPTTSHCGEKEDDSCHPWPYLDSMFSYEGLKENSFRMKCLLCLPKPTELLAFKNSPSNLKKHIKVS